MKKIVEWNVGAASNLNELSKVLHYAGNSLDTQVLASPALEHPELVEVKQQLADIVTQLYRLERIAVGFDIDGPEQG